MVQHSLAGFPVLCLTFVDPFMSSSLDLTRCSLKVKNEERFSGRKFFVWGESVVSSINTSCKSLAAHGVHVRNVYSACTGCYATPPRSLLACTTSQPRRLEATCCKHLDLWICLYNQGKAEQTSPILVKSL